MRLGLISDTHGRDLPPDVFDLFRNIDHILHAGDVGSMRILDALKGVAPVSAVAGNIDPPGVLPWRLELEFDGVRLGLCHGHTGAGRTTPDRAASEFRASGVGIVVFGHSHQPYLAKHGALVLINPGSATEPRSAPDPTVAILDTNDPMGIEFFPLPRQTGPVKRLYSV